MQTVKISHLNPIQFHKVPGGKYACDEIPSFEEDRIYLQKWINYVDTLKFQVQILDGYWGLFEYKLLDSNFNVVETYRGGELGTLNGFDVWGPLETELILEHDPGVYYIELTVNTTLSDNTYISEPFELVSSLPESLLIEYSHNRNEYDMAFYPDGELTSKLTFQIRVEGGVMSDGFLPGSKDSFFVDQDRRVVMLDSTPYNVYKFTFGPVSGIPNWMANKINRILSLQEVSINSLQYVKNDGAKLESIREKNYPLAGWQIELVKVESEDSFVEDEAVPGFEIIKYGALYNYPAATDERLICADGWEVPEKTDWETLNDYINDYTTAGGDLKETGLIHWDTPNEGATNTYDFNGRGGGIRFSNGGFDLLKYVLSLLTTDNFMVGEVNATWNYQLFSDSTLGHIGDNEIHVGGYLRIFRLATESELLLDDGLISATYTGNDGKVYRCTKIGTQVWIADNLAETKFRNGDTIPEVTDNSAWAALTTAGMCYYDNDPTNA